MTDSDAPVEVSAEDASDAQLRTWAGDNGIKDVPASGKLSAVWRETITNAMAEALDPKEEVSAPTTSTTSSTPKTETSAPVKTEEAAPKTETLPAKIEAPSTTVDSTVEESPESTKEETPTEPEPVVEYRTPWVAPETWVSGQAYTA